MHQVDKPKNGFTLIELLLVLSIVISLSIIVLPSMSKTVDQIKVNQFLKVLESDIFYIQNQAPNYSSKGLRMSFTKDYYRIANSSIEIKREYYPDTMELRRANKTVTFSKSGSVTKGDTIRFTIADQIVKFVFPLGKGRYYIEKL